LDRTYLDQLPQAEIESTYFMTQSVLTPSPTPSTSPAGQKDPKESSTNWDNYSSSSTRNASAVLRRRSARSNMKLLSDLNIFYRLLNQVFGTVGVKLVCIGVWSDN